MHDQANRPAYYSEYYEEQQDLVGAAHGVSYEPEDLIFTPRCLWTWVFGCFLS
jgi:hypothetical protein